MRTNDLDKRTDFGTRQNSSFRRLFEKAVLVLTSPVVFCATKVSRRFRMTAIAAMGLVLGCLVICSSTAEAQTITWGYTDPVSLRVGLDEVFINNVGFDMLGYARDYAVLRGADRNTVSVYLVSNNSSGWRMRYFARGAWRVEGFNMLDVARWQGFRNYGNRVKNYGVYLTNPRSPYAWKGAYILRRF